MMGSSRRGGGAVFVDPFVMGTGGACRDHVGSVNWLPDGRSGGARTSAGTLIPSLTPAGLVARARLYVGVANSRARQIKSIKYETFIRECSNFGK